MLLTRHQICGSFRIGLDGPGTETIVRLQLSSRFSYVAKVQEKSRKANPERKPDASSVVCDLHTPRREHELRLQTKTMSRTRPNRARSYFRQGSAISARGQPLTYDIGMSNSNWGSNKPRTHSCPLQSRSLFSHSLWQ